MTLDSLLTDIKGVGPQLAQKFACMQIHNVADLIDYYPRRYDDYSKICKISEIRPGIITIRAKIIQATGKYVRRGMHITEAIASDKSGSVRIVWFNQPYRSKSIKPNCEYFISGNFELRNQRLVITSPAMELVSNFPINTARIVPIYKVMKGLKSLDVRRALRSVMPVIDKLDDTIPPWIIKNENLLPLCEAMRQMHFPESSEKLQESQRRIGFEEVFSLSLASLLNKQELSNVKSLVIPFREQLAKEFVSHLPFKLTNAQRKATWQIYKDISFNSTKPKHFNVVQGSNEEQVSRTNVYGERTTEEADAIMRQESVGMPSFVGQQDKTMLRFGPMNRLLEGDVGSGKTVVATMAALMAMEQGFQVAIMAPTELLARQHADTIHNLLEPMGYEKQICLLVGSMKPNQKIIAHEKIKTGDSKLIIGTHALIQEKVDMHKLGLVIIDEQHRFGVIQRKKIMAKAKHMPHVLTMTATPIPRSLVLTLYGDLDLSIIDSKPEGRKPIITKICSPNSRDKLYEKIDKVLESGRQMFVVCPLINETEGSQATKSAEAVFTALKTGFFKHRRLGLLHGKMKALDKNKVMKDFVDNKIDILVATTVIEVGVDVPNATIILIENADQFGLAQIHQLRGRIDRSAEQGYCYLMMSDSSAPTRRLRAVESSDDGFALAEMDLEIRGPGALYGTMQHGQLDLRVANLADTRLISSARQCARDFIEKQEDLLQYKLLNERIKKLRTVTNLN